jgi:hypothetical protein
MYMCRTYPFQKNIFSRYDKSEIAWNFGTDKRLSDIYNIYIFGIVGFYNNYPRQNGWNKTWNGGGTGTPALEQANLAKFL